MKGFFVSITKVLNEVNNTLAQMEMKTPEVLKTFFIGFAKRPKEALANTYKKSIQDKELECTVGNSYK